MRETRARTIAIACLTAVVLLIVHTPLVAGESATAYVNSDDQLANYSSPLLYRVFIAVSPQAFEPMAFMDALLLVYQSTFGKGQFPSVASLRLRSWCGQPNSTYDFTIRYCAKGAGLDANYSTVFLEYTVSPIGVVVNDGSLSAYGLVSLTQLNVSINGGRPYAVTPIETTNLLYDPDTYREGDYTFFDAVTQNTVVVWVIFVLVLIVCIGIFVGCCCCCRIQDRRWGQKNQAMLRGLFAGFRLRRDSEQPVDYHGGRRHESRGDGIGASRYRDMSEVNSTAAHYGVYSPSVDGVDARPAAGHASQPPTSRASEFWPGVSGKAHRGEEHGYDEEMEERSLGSARRY